MNSHVLESTADLRKVQKQMRRRYVSLKFKDHDVHVSFGGGIFRARFAGCSDVAFGGDEQQAVQRLQKLPNMIRSTFGIPKWCDVLADRAEFYAERAAAKRGKRSARWNPRGHRV